MSSHQAAPSLGARTLDNNLTIAGEGSMVAITYRPISSGEPVQSVVLRGFR
jgi:hypothetical protein